MVTRGLRYEHRVFQVWGYTVGLSRLLLRSTKSEESGTRIDVLFQNVDAMKLPTLLHGLVVSEPDLARSNEITEETGILPDGDHIFFALHGSDYSGYVVAGVMVTCEDRLEYFEPSALWQEPMRAPGA